MQKKRSSNPRRVKNIMSKKENDSKNINNGCSFAVIATIIVALITSIVTIFSTIYPDISAHVLFRATSTLTFTPTPVFTSTPIPSFTSALTATPSPTVTQTPTPLPPGCLSQDVDNDQAIKNLIRAEAESANFGEYGLPLMQIIFAPDAVIHDYAVPIPTPPKTWPGPESLQVYRASNKTFVRNVIHFDILPTGSGISGPLATYTSGSMGEYINDVTPNWTPFTNGSIKDYVTSENKIIRATQYGSEHWLLTKNSQACWRIIQFDFDAGHIKFP